MSSMLSQHVLVLNRLWQAVNVCSARRALTLLFQGPIADSLTHVGQIAMLRRIASCPVKGENYFVAKIETGRTGADQAPGVKEFE